MQFQIENGKDREKSNETQAYFHEWNILQDGDPSLS
jgi:hypothetical protein